MISFLALVQRPGDEQPLFDPHIFYVILMGAILVPSMIAFLLLDCQYLKTRWIPAIELQSTDDTEWHFGIPSWWRLIWVYTAVYSYVVVAIWVFDAALIPYAVQSTAMDGGTNTDTEQYVFCLMYVGMVAGSLIVSFVRISDDFTVWIMTVVFTGLQAVYLWIACDTMDLWRWNGANIFLVIIIFLIGFIYGVLIPTLIINVDERYPQYSLKMNNYMSIIALILMFVFVWISYFVVEVMHE